MLPLPGERLQLQTYKKNDIFAAEIEKDRTAMKCQSLKTLVLALGLLVSAGVGAQPKEKVLRGFDGGMMLHAGYLGGTLVPGEAPVSGCPFGLGGVARLHLGKCFRIGGEGYVSTMNLRGNGSYLRYGWGGILADVYGVFGRFQPYGGVTLGGGAMTAVLMTETPSEAWAPIDGTRYRKQGFMAVDPFVGCDFILTKAIHLTLKVDCLCGFGRDLQMPVGPRVYFGVLFYR